MGREGEREGRGGEGGPTSKGRERKGRGKGREKGKREGKGEGRVGEGRGGEGQGPPDVMSGYAYASPRQHRRRRIAISTSSSQDLRVGTIIVDATSPYHPRRHVVEGSSSHLQVDIYVAGLNHGTGVTGTPMQLFLSSTHVITARNTFRSSGVSYRYTHYRG